MVSFTTLIVGYSVSPVRFTKSNFREVELETVSNFRRALAISLAEVSQQLDFKARVRQYSTYLDLDSYPPARKLGYDIFSAWQNLTMLTYPGTGLNLTTSMPIFHCSWNSSSGISWAGANVSLDILSYGFYGYSESSVASLNLTLLNLNQTGSVTSFFFSLRAENDQPVPDLSDSSIHIFYNKTNGAWASPDGASTRIYYLGEGAYYVRFNVNATEIPTAPHIRLIVQDSRGIVVGAHDILSPSTTGDDCGPVTSNVAATPNPSNGASSVTATATVSDLYGGWSEIQSAECVVKNPGGAVVRDVSMAAVDGAFNEMSEDVTVNFNVAGWTLGNYTIYVRGQDSEGNWGDTNSTILRITSVPSMHVESIDMSWQRHGWHGSVYAIAVVAILDQNGSPVRNARVTVHWSGATTEGPYWGYTNSMGRVTFQSRSVYPHGRLTFRITIDNVQKQGYIYDPAANKETTDSVSYP